MGLDDFLYQKIRDHFPFTPSQDQEALFHQWGTFLRSTQRIFVLNGYAGTGKTTAVRALVGALKEMDQKVVLLAPTGRSAKVLAGYTGAPAHTIHKTIYRQQTPTSDEENVRGLFSLQPNKNKHTLFVVDEASLLSNKASGGGLYFGSGHLLDDLMDYVFSTPSEAGNKLLLLGDSAQLPPIGLDVSPALDPSQLETYGPTQYMEMKEVLRQAADSGILYNATLLRHHITHGVQQLPTWKTEGFSDIHCINSGDVLECLSDALSRFGVEDVVVLCRSNKRANRYNAGIRGRILYREEQVARGDRVMVVRNCYHFTESLEELDFIANGDVAEILRIRKYQERYGFHFAEAVLRFPDYNNVELDVRLLLDTLTAESPALSEAEQERFFQEVAQDYATITNRRKRYTAIREDLYLNALQVKYASAVTCHKAQGGQWKAVFVDKSFFDDLCTIEQLRWYYTAFTRAQEQLYLINF